MNGWLNYLRQLDENQLLEAAKGHMALILLLGAPLVAAWFIFETPVIVGLTGLGLCFTTAVSFMIVESERERRR